MQPLPPSGPVSPSTGNPAQLGGILLLVCALFILIGLFTRSWFSMDRGRMEAGVGLLGYKFCRGDECEGKFFEPDMFDDEKKDITGARFLVILGGLGTAVLAGIGGAMALSRQARKAPLLPLYIAGGITAFFAIYFVARTLGQVEGDNGPGVSWSFFLTFLGAGGSILIGALLVKPAARREPGGLPGAIASYPGAMQGMPAGTPLCPRCQGATTYAAQYQKYFCGRCQQYI